MIEYVFPVAVPCSRLQIAATIHPYFSVVDRGTRLDLKKVRPVDRTHIRHLEPEGMQTVPGPRKTQGRKMLPGTCGCRVYEREAISWANPALASTVRGRQAAALDRHL